MQAVLFSVRPARSFESNDLLDIDIKSFEDSWSPVEWKRVLGESSYGIAALTYYGNIVGFIALRGTDDGVELLKIAIKPHFRGNKASYLLLQAMYELARCTRAKTLFTIIPERHVYPGPANLTVWLGKVGFKATKPFLKCHFNANGESEDGVKFVTSYRSQQ